MLTILFAFERMARQREFKLDSAEDEDFRLEDFFDLTCLSLSDASSGKSLLKYLLFFSSRKSFITVSHAYVSRS